MDLQIRELGEADFGRWNACVERAPDATFFHLAGWKRVLERAFGHPTHYLYAEREGRVEGILPLARVRSLLFGDMLVSTPFCVYGGIVAENDEAAAGLRQAACDLADRLRVDSLELRNLQPSGLDWPTKSLYVTFRKQIDPDPEVNLKAIPRKQRAMVRKGIKAGLQSEHDDGWRRLYRVYSESVRNLGTPVFPQRLFQVLREEFGDACEVLMVTHEGRDIAGVMSFYFRDQVLPYYGGSIALARALKGNDFMYWELMRRSGERGIRLFDYGRSKEGTGSYSFKKNWGFTPEPLYYENYLVEADTIPEINPMNPKYQLFIRAWKRLPLPVANTVGPLLARSLG
ncbi:MAG TPA: FemAB family PEP-CTERM system-associated protein [Sedimenticola thiotaurini]|uniref:FemAB family PEP-CTERM system-associated protein n=1 Tax=Sedimenticola thiotaurini TaxID=1543721 RepID=A0A831RRL8_9GAMM|nr:FemAB family PEP-CTERM system-associated protein [Sedimenticola thiotaurini]